MIQSTYVQQVKVVPGAGSLKLIGEIVKEAGYHKALLVHGQSIGKSGIADRIKGYLKDAGIDYAVFTEVQPDPPAEIVDRGAAVAKNEGCDCVIAVGGGSAIDTGKGINILRFNEGSILDYATNPDYNVCSGLITIPTTSGTGSELSNGSIISDTKNDLKVPILCFKNMSEYTILDPELTMGMPEKLTLYTGLDTFSHAVESYTSNISNMMSELVSESVMETVVEFLPKALKDPKDLAARSKMQAAAATGGWMLYTASAHVGHSLAHVLGASLHLVHGAACAYGLPNVLKAISPVVPEKVAKVGRILGADIAENDTPVTIGDKTAAAYIAFCDKLGLEKIEEKDLTVDDELLKTMTKKVANEPLAVFTPMPVTEDLAEKLLKETLKL